jgi:hypothetical protein
VKDNPSLFYHQIGEIYITGSPKSAEENLTMGLNRPEILLEMA